MLGRPYPAQVYLYACSLYSKNPGMGQRAVAEATRAEFGLETFSHSTVSRTFRALEQSRELALERRFGDEVKPGVAEAPNLVVAAAKREAKEDGPAATAATAKRFPTVKETAGRREAMRRHLRDIHYGSKTADIETASLGFVEKWHKKTGRLLL